MVSIFATGIVKADLADKIGLSLDAITGAIQADLRDMGKVPTSDEPVEKLESVLKTIRFLYKGSRVKSSNKIKNNRSFGDMKKANNHRFSARELFFNISIEKSLSYCVEHEFGNCGEMARIAYALCHKLGLNPELAEFNSEGLFTHTVCRVKVGDIYYMLDIWANILCEEKQYLSLLRQKMIDWDKAGKRVLNGKHFTARIDEEFKIPSDAQASANDISTLKLIEAAPINGEHNIVSSDFFNVLFNKLALKLINES